MEFTTSIRIAAPPERVWAVITDVERWPEWTASVTSIRLLDPGPLRVGSRARIKQPKLPATVWRVSDLADGREFTWVATGPGVRTTARHGVVAAGDGSQATLWLDQSGLVGTLFGRFTQGMTDRYLAMEAEGLKARSENP